MSIKQLPTVGRVVYVWIGTDDQDRYDEVSIDDDQQAFRADILFVHPDGEIRVEFTDHAGDHYLDDLELRDPGEDDRHGQDVSYAAWMPYQAKKHAEESSSIATFQAATTSPMVQSALEINAAGNLQLTDGKDV